MAMIGSIGLTSGLSQNQMQQAGNTLNAPRPLGFIERASGLATGLEQLERQLASLVSRIDGSGENSAAMGSAIPVGLGSHLSDAEHRLRSCMSLIDELHNRF